jgi:hypothetical protein
MFIVLVLATIMQLCSANDEYKHMYTNGLKNGEAFTLRCGGWRKDVFKYYKSSKVGEEMTITWRKKSVSFVPVAYEYVIHESGVDPQPGARLEWVEPGDL